MRNRAPSERNRSTKFLFAMLPMILLLGSAEILIRWTSAAETCPDPTKSFDVYWACDPLLYFKNKPDLEVVGQPLNRAGFRNREFIPKKPDTFRILALGDSCTFGLGGSEDSIYVREPYHRVLEHMVNRTNAHARVWFLTAPQAFATEEDLARYEGLLEDAQARKLLAFNAMQSFAQMQDVHNNYMRRPAKSRAI